MLQSSPWHSITSYLIMTGFLINCAGPWVTHHLAASHLDTSAERSTDPRWGLTIFSALWEFTPSHYLYTCVSVTDQHKKHVNDLSTSLNVIRKRSRSWEENEEFRTQSGNETNSWLIVCVSPRWNMTRLDKMRRGTMEICQHNIHHDLGVSESESVWQ